MKAVLDSSAAPSRRSCPNGLARGGEAITRRSWTVIDSRPAEGSSQRSPGSPATRLAQRDLPRPTSRGTPCGSGTAPASGRRRRSRLERADRHPALHVVDPSSTTLIVTATQGARPSTDGIDIPLRERVAGRPCGCSWSRTPPAHGFPALVPCRSPFPVHGYTGHADIAVVRARGLRIESVTFRRRPTVTTSGSP